MNKKEAFPKGRKVLVKSNADPSKVVWVSGMDKQIGQTLIIMESESPVSGTGAYRMVKLDDGFNYPVEALELVAEALPAQAEDGMCTHLRFLMKLFGKMRLGLVTDQAEISCNKCGKSIVLEKE